MELSGGEWCRWFCVQGIKVQCHLVSLSCELLSVGLFIDGEEEKVEK